MLPNEITLAVDVLNNGTPVNLVLRRFEEQLNRSTYIAADHTAQSRDIAQVYRTLPTVSGNFRGVKKTAVKFTEDVIVKGVDGVADLTSPAILELNFSFPVGTTAAQELTFRQRAVALLDRDDIMVPLNNVQEI